MTSVGTSIRARSWRKSSYHVATQARQAVAEAPAATFQLGLNGLFAHTLPQQEIRVVEILEKLAEERVAICGDGLLYPREDAAVHTLRVVRRL